MRTEDEIREKREQVRKRWKEIAPPRTFSPDAEAIGATLEVLDWVLGERDELSEDVG